MNTVNLINPNSCVIFVTLDSCRWDTAIKAHTPFFDRLGGMRAARTHGSYTVPSHYAFFTGHLPSILHFDNEAPYYTEHRGRLWEVGADKPSNCTLHSFREPTIIEGYRNLGFRVVGVGGVSQFRPNGVLRQLPWEDFLYYGPSGNEEKMAARPPTWFPLNHCEEIAISLEGADKWFLFVNMPETHYPYDTGAGLPTGMQESFRRLGQSLNLRQTDHPPDHAESSFFHAMQVSALEVADSRLENLYFMLNERNKPDSIMVIVCGDHGEMFGDIYDGQPRWGHLMPAEAVMTVPLLINSRLLPNEKC